MPLDTVDSHINGSQHAGAYSIVQNDEAAIPYVERLGVVVGDGETPISYNGNDSGRYVCHICHSLPMPWSEVSFFSHVDGGRHEINIISRFPFNTVEEDDRLEKEEEEEAIIFYVDANGRNRRHSRHVPAYRNIMTHNLIGVAPYIGHLSNGRYVCHLCPDAGGPSMSYIDLDKHLHESEQCKVAQYGIDRDESKSEVKREMARRGMFKENLKCEMHKLGLEAWRSDMEVAMFRYIMTTAEEYSVQYFGQEKDDPRSKAVMLRLMHKYGKTVAPGTRFEEESHL